jgi:hypothetical protein
MAVVLRLSSESLRGCRRPADRYYQYPRVPGASGGSAPPARRAAAAPRRLLLLRRRHAHARARAPTRTPPPPRAVHSIKWTGSPPVLWVEHGTEQRRVPMEGTPALVELPFVPSKTVDMMVRWRAQNCSGRSGSTANTEGQATALRAEPGAGTARSGWRFGLGKVGASAAHASWRRPVAAGGGRQRKRCRMLCCGRSSDPRTRPLRQAFDPASSCDETGFVAGATVSVEQVGPCGTAGRGG